MDNFFFFIVDKIYKKNTYQPSLKNDTDKSLFKKNVDKDIFKKNKYDNNIEDSDIYEQFVNYLF
mgnify:CR=1 FL=1|tara:strand:+ start:300 stop:491 length:192 start_codon:yes stop_codon:yes gene_type:complete